MLLLLCYTISYYVHAPQWAASGRAYFIRLAKIEISCRLKHRQASWDNNESGIMGSHPALGFPQQTTNQTNMHRSTLSIHFIKIFKLVSLSAIFEDLYWIFAKIFSQQNQLLSSDAQLCYAMLANQATHCTYICICISVWFVFSFSFVFGVYWPKCVMQCLPTRQHIVLTFVFVFLVWFVFVF